MIRSWKFFALIPLVLALTGNLSAQSGGSIYSFHNLGHLENGGVGEASGRGGVEAPIRSTDGLNFGNPAGWTGLGYVAIQAGMTFEQYANTSEGATAYNNRTALDYIAAGFPLSDSLPLVVGLGVRPYSTVSYVTGGTLEIPSADTTVTGGAIYSGSGGFSAGFSGVSVEPIDRVSVGANLEVLFGGSERVSRLDFSAPGFINAGYVTEETYSGIGGVIGAQVEPIDNLVLGASFSLPVSLNIDRSTAGLYRTSAGDDTAGTAYDTLAVDVPATIRGGLSWQTGRTVIAGEVLMQSWSGTSPFEQTVQDRSRYGLSVDYLPDDSPGATGLDRWSFRGGLYYDASYVAIEGRGVTGMGGALGVSIPFATTGILGSGAAVDLGIEVGTRGTGEDSDVSELSTKVSAGIRINEFWFR